MLLVGAAGQADEPVKNQATELLSTPLTGDLSREVRVLNVIQPPGADSGRHFHHGDQYTIVQEGEIKIAVDGDGEHVLKAGQVLHIPPMTVHRTQNLSGKPARTTEFFIVAKGKPLTEKAE
ncbi:MAG TPA: cupin domain-containing protein [Stellaceae bacterium]|nr:cupin domain-containing protein [Stellaceae bacterium]